MRQGLQRLRPLVAVDPDLRGSTHAPHRCYNKRPVAHELADAKPLPPTLMLRRSTTHSDWARGSRAAGTSVGATHTKLARSLRTVAGPDAGRPATCNRRPLSRISRPVPSMSAPAAVGDAPSSVEPLAASPRCSAPDSRARARTRRGQTITGSSTYVPLQWAIHAFASPRAPSHPSPPPHPPCPRPPATPLAPARPNPAPCAYPRSSPPVSTYRRSAAVRARLLVFAAGAAAGPPGTS